MKKIEIKTVKELKEFLDKFDGNEKLEDLPFLIGDDMTGDYHDFLTLSVWESDVVEPEVSVAPKMTLFMKISGPY